VTDASNASGGAANGLQTFDAERALQEARLSDDVGYAARGESS
jgi:hypothetical protein